MPTLKKRSGKTTITLYANERRQIEGAFETLRFIENNAAEGPLQSNCGVLSSGLHAVLHMLDHQGDKKQQEAIEADSKEVAEMPY